MSTVSTEPFDQLVQQLTTHGFWDAAVSISSVRSSGWTTSSEMIGRLGMEILKIQSGSAAAPEELKETLERCMKEVRKVWPKIKLPDK
jgi:hypothetical protein